MSNGRFIDRGHNSELKEKKVVVTGGAGFIGSHLVRYLLDEGYTVHIVDNFSTGKRENLNGLEGDFFVHALSFTNYNLIVDIFNYADVVYHLGALPSVPRSISEPLQSHWHNLTGTLTVLLAARDACVRRVVYAASSSAYGDHDSEYKLETVVPQPLSPYGVTKLAGEHYCHAFYASYGLETVSLRFFNVFGPRQDPNSLYAAVIPKFIIQMLNGYSPTIYGDGLQSRDFTFVDNVIHGLYLASKNPDAIGQTFNLASGGNINLLTLVDCLNDLLGTVLKPKHVAPYIGDIKHSRADIQQITNVMGYQPKVTFEDGLERTVAWYRDRIATWTLNNY